MSPTTIATTTTTTKTTTAAAEKNELRIEMRSGEVNGTTGLPLERNSSEKKKKGAEILCND